MGKESNLSPQDNNISGNKNQKENHNKDNKAVQQLTEGSEEDKNSEYFNSSI